MSKTEWLFSNVRGSIFKNSIISIKKFWNDSYSNSVVYSQYSWRVDRLVVVVFPSLPCSSRNNNVSTETAVAPKLKNAHECTKFTVLIIMISIPPQKRLPKGNISWCSGLRGHTKHRLLLQSKLWCVGCCCLSLSLLPHRIKLIKVDVESRRSVRNARRRGRAWRPAEESTRRSNFPGRARLVNWIVTLAKLAVCLCGRERRVGYIPRSISACSPFFFRIYFLDTHYTSRHAVYFNLHISLKINPVSSTTRLFVKYFF